MTIQLGQFGFEAAWHDDDATLSISQDGPRLIIDENAAPPGMVSLMAGFAFALAFIAFGLFVITWDMDAASEPLRYPVAGLFALVGLGLLWLMLSRKNNIRRVIADSDTQTIEYGRIVAGKNADWNYRQKGVFDYRRAERFDTGYVDHTAPGAERTLTGLYVKAPEGPRGGLLVMGALYEIEIVIDYIYRHMSDSAQAGNDFDDQGNSLPRSFVPQNRNDR